MNKLKSELLKLAPNILTTLLFTAVLLQTFNGFAAQIVKSDQTIVKSKNMLLPFTSDGCSYVPDGTITNQNKWLHCCVNHDIKYWVGGTKQDRKNADRELEQCVGEAQNDVLGKLFYIGVSLGGTPRFNTTFRWGYGWKHDRGYHALTNEEQALVQNKAPLIASIKAFGRASKAPSTKSTNSNYCVDDAIAAVESIDKTIEVTSYKIAQNGDVLIKTDACLSEFRVKLKVHSKSLCTTPDSREVRPFYAGKILIPGNCLSSIP